MAKKKICQPAVFQDVSKIPKVFFAFSVLLMSLLDDN